ncbi:MAG: hypothetical protein JJV97_04190 [SAR324 cluster bacterium]|nr:hypothetical protein [SAR324 cluster bacterium]
MRFFLPRFFFILIIFFGNNHLVNAFSIEGKLIYPPQPELVGKVPLVVLKLNPPGETPALFPVGRTTTDEKGGYSLTDLDFEEGSQFQLGILILENRLASDTFTYSGQENISFDFLIKQKLNPLAHPSIPKTDSEHFAISISGKLTGQTSLSGLGNSVFLQKLFLDQNGGVLTEIIDEQPITDNGKFIFKVDSVSKNSSFKVGIHYQGLQIFSPLFFSKTSNIKQDLLIPASTKDKENLIIKRDTIVFNVAEEGFEAAYFIYILNQSNKIIELEQPLIKKLPARLDNFSSPDTIFKQVVFDGDNVQINGPFLPGERVIFFTHELPSFFSYRKFKSGLIDNTEVAEVIYKKKSITLEIDNIDSLEETIKIGGADGYFVRRINLDDSTNQSELVISIKSKFWSQSVIYIISLIVFLSLVAISGYLIIKKRRVVKL